MTKVLKMLGSIGLAAMMGVALLGASVALAESPPNPPSRFAGTVTVDGVKVASGTVIEARIGSTSCGTTSTFDQGGNANYVLDVPALDPGATPNCGTENAAVSFFVGGQLASQTGSWKNYQLNVLNLTVVSATATPPGGGTTTTPTPKVPDTGNGAGTTGTSEGSPAILLFAALGLGAVAFGVGGAAVARRSR
ncbi:MAG: hypothetical protein WD557_03680 [Dehalococcoidia bacterium]